MNLLEVNDSLESIELPGKQKKGILQVIDTKISNDMKEYIAEIRQFERVMEARFQILEDKIQMVDAKIQMVHDKLSNEIKTVYWVIGIAYALLLFVLSRK